MYGTLPETGPQDLYSALVIGEGDVDELVKPARSEDCGVYNVRPVSGTDDEHVFLGTHAVHLRQHLMGDRAGRSVTYCITIDIYYHFGHSGCVVPYTPVWRTCIDGRVSPVVLGRIAL